jgi:hypothetical protein
MADGESHSEDGESEGQGDAGKADAEGGVRSGKDGAAASAKDKPIGSETFSQGSFEERQWNFLRARSCAASN